MAMQVSTVVIGGGLAGTTLTWALLEAGDDVLLVDRHEAMTSSKVAAGLISPVTGKRLAQLDEFDVWWETAKRFYRHIEGITGVSLLHETSLLRLFRHQEERLRVQKRVASGWQVDCQDKPRGPYASPFGGAELPVAGRLDVTRYLEASHHHFRKLGKLADADLHPLYDLERRPNHVEIKKLDVFAQRVVFCQGFHAAFNPYFARLLFNPAKGQILTVKIPSLNEHRIVQHGVWLVRIDEGDTYKVGATYEHDCLDNSITPAAREDILARLRLMHDRDVTVVGQEAGVRPVLMQQQPRIGTHPADPRLGYFNGLGSKGSLQGPRLAQMLGEHLVNDTPIDPRFDLRSASAFQHAEAQPPEVTNLTHVAQEFVKSVLKPGEVAIDATAGNGHDTVFLASVVGPKGHVYAIDQQTTALENTNARLSLAGIHWVTLIHASHATLDELVSGPYHGEVAAIMFNLGYLPGSPRDVITTAETTRPAIRQALGLLRPGGILTVLAYVGHPGGSQEEAVVRAIWSELSPQQFTINLGYASPPSEKSPRLFLARRRL